MRNFTIYVVLLVAISTHLVVGVSRSQNELGRRFFSHHFLQAEETTMMRLVEAPRCNATIEFNCINADNCGWCNSTLPGSQCQAGNSSGPFDIYCPHSDWIFENPPTIEVPGGIIAGIAIVFGVIFLLYGYRLIRAMLFIFGLCAGAGVSWVLLSSHTSLDFYLKLGVSLGIGALLGFILCLILYIGIFCLGLGLGFVLATTICSLKDGDLIPDLTIRDCVIFGTTLVFGMLALMLQKPLLITATSGIGAAGVVCGIDYFLNFWGLEYAAMAFISQETVVNSDIHFDALTWVMLAGMLVLALFGVAIQFRKTGADFDHWGDPNNSKNNAYQPIGTGPYRNIMIN